MILLCDIGNTHTHLGLANRSRVTDQVNVLTAKCLIGAFPKSIENFLDNVRLEGVAVCSVVPRATPFICRAIKTRYGLDCLELTAKTAVGIGIEYPNPRSIGPDRLANAIAVKHHFGAPAIVVDFGTAVTFDVVNQRGNYIGGIITPGLAAMTDYLHEKTALLPRIKIREVRQVVGKNTEQAMLIGAVHGYRGLVSKLIAELRCELNTRRLPVVATGGYAQLIASKLPEITAVKPLLTLEGLRLVWQASSGMLSDRAGKIPTPQPSQRKHAGRTHPPGHLE
jgi:type III pantothenate kinase